MVTSDMIELDWSRWKNFSRVEFVCHCGCGKADMNVTFMNKLQALRTKANFGFSINSGFRCAVYNAAIGGGPAHVLGKAADIRCFGEKAAFIAGEWKQLGFTGKGESQKLGSPLGDRFIHLDDLLAEQASGLRPRVWNY